MSVDFATLRTHMVDNQVRTQDVTHRLLIEAMLRTPRESCAPGIRADAAYADSEVEYGEGRFLLRPRDVSKLLQAVQPQAGETALAIAAPYAAAVLSALGLSVTRLDEGDLKSPGGSYDIVISEGGVTSVPAAWTECLKPGGRLAVIERDRAVGVAKLYHRTAAGVSARALFNAFPPVMAGFEAEPAFVF
jgi:protein-L-isoaspartate(D-aspartate) O-methyltransferase